MYCCRRRSGIIGEAGRFPLSISVWIAIVRHRNRFLIPNHPLHIVLMLDIGMGLACNPARINNNKLRVHREAIGAYKITKKLLQPPTSLYQRTKEGGGGDMSTSVLTGLWQDVNESEHHACARKDIKLSVPYPPLRWLKGPVNDLQSKGRGIPAKQV